MFRTLCINELKSNTNKIVNVAIVVYNSLRKPNVPARRMCCLRLTTTNVQRKNLAFSRIDSVWIASMLD